MPIKLNSYVTWSTSETVASVQLPLNAVFFCLAEVVSHDVNAAALSGYQFYYSSICCYIRRYITLKTTPALQDFCSEVSGFLKDCLSRHKLQQTCFSCLRATRRVMWLSTTWMHEAKYCTVLHLHMCTATVPLVQYIDVCTTVLSTIHSCRHLNCQSTHWEDVY